MASQYKYHPPASPVTHSQAGLFLPQPMSASQFGKKGRRTPGRIKCVVSQSFPMGPWDGGAHGHRQQVLGDRVDASSPWPGLLLQSPSACHGTDASTVPLSCLINCSVLTWLSGQVKRSYGDGEAGMGEKPLERTLLKAVLLCQGFGKGHP